MKRLGGVLAICAGLMIPAVQAHAQRYGLGAIVGEPTGVSGKMWVGTTTAFDAAVAWSFYDEGGLEFHADYLLHNFGLLKPEKGRLPFYYGIGARLDIGDNYNQFGVRAPLGLDYIFQSNAVDLFFELVPTLNLSPDTDFELGAAIGARYFFQ